VLKELKEKVFNFGDTELLNEFVYHNYCSSISYFDDDMEKTSLYLDMLSKYDTILHYTRRSQNYEMYGSYYLPLYAFKKYCSGSRALDKRSEYPKALRQMQMETKKNNHIFDRLLDIKPTGKGYKKINGPADNDEERYKLGSNSTIQTGMKRSDFRRDMLPYIYQIIHPNIRD
jgi:hypothetical protein